MSASTYDGAGGESHGPPPSRGRRWGESRPEWLLPLVLTALAGLTACSRQADAGDVTGAEPIPCRASAAAALSADCTVERMATPEGTALTVRNPDGSFRRLLMVGDGRGVIAADGAEPAVVRPGDAKSIDVAIGGMVYRLPARVTR